MVTVIRRQAGELTIDPLDAQLRQDAMSRGIHWIGGMSDWATVIENDHDKVVIVPLDGSPAIGPFDGWLAAVNP